MSVCVCVQLCAMWDEVTMGAVKVGIEIGLAFATRGPWVRAVLVVPRYVSNRRRRRGRPHASLESTIKNCKCGRIADVWCSMLRLAPAGFVTSCLFFSSEAYFGKGIRVEQRKTVRNSGAQ